MKIKQQIEKLDNIEINNFKKSILYVESCFMNEQIVEMKIKDKLKNIKDFFFLLDSLEVK